MADQTQDLGAVLAATEGDAGHAGEASSDALPTDTQQIEGVLGGDANTGNPVFTKTTTQMYSSHSIYSNKAKALPDRFDNPEMISGYGKTKRNSNPLYQTSSSDFGSIAPSVHTSHTEYHGRSQGFSNHLGAAGMPRNRSLNTSMDRSRVHTSLDP